jgi:glycosyltransferase involved in cell wall biosynthesis
LTLKKINILHLVTGLGVGGAERVVLDLTKNTDSNKFNVSVVSMSKRIEMLDDFRKNKIDTIALQKNNSAWDVVEILFYLNRYIKKNKIDIIHAHMAHASIVASIIKLSNPKVKIVFTSHNIDMESKIREYMLFLFKPLRSVDILFSKEQEASFYKKNIMVIPNGIKVNDYKLEMEKEKKFIFLSVGRLEEQKNHKSLIEEVVKLKKSYEFEVWIAGDGHLRKELESLVKNHQLEKYIKFLGVRKDIPLLLNQVHCFILPSLWEGLPIVLLEAGASELPIISTPVGNIPSLLNNENAYLANLEQFSDKMTEVMENYDIALDKAKKLKEKIVKEYSIENIVKKHEDVYVGIMYGQ